MNGLFFYLAAEVSNFADFFMSSSILWAFLTLVAIIVEVVTVSLVSLWFIPGTVLALILSFIPGMPLWIEIVIFIAVSIVCFILFRKKFKEKTNFERVATNADAVIGKNAVVTEQIDNIHAKGAVKVDGKEWTARSDDGNVIISEGEIVTVLRIEGVKLICSKKQ